MVRLNILAGGVLAFSLFLRLVLPRQEPSLGFTKDRNRQAGVRTGAEVLHVDDIVEWVNADIFQHTATADGRGFDVDLRLAPRAGRF